MDLLLMYTSKVEYGEKIFSLVTLKSNIYVTWELYIISKNFNTI